MTSTRSLQSCAPVPSRFSITTPRLTTVGGIADIGSRVLPGSSIPFKNCLGIVQLK
jgi:hypothetical protein